MNYLCGNENQQVVKRLYTYFSSYKMALLIVFFALIVFSIVDAGMVYFIKPLIDDGLTKSNRNMLVIGGFLIIGIFMLRGTANFVSSYMVKWISFRVIQQIRQEVYNHLLFLPRAFYDNNPSGKLISKITYDVEQVANATSNAVITLIRESLIIIVLIVMMIYSSWQLSLIFLSIGPLICFIIYRVAIHFREKSRILQDSMGAITQHSEQLIKGHKDILAFTTQEYEQYRFYKVNNNNRRQSMKLVLVSSASNPVIQLIASFAMAAVLWLASLPSVVDNITAGAFTLTLVAMGSLLRPLKQLSKVNEKLQIGLAAATSLFNLLDETTEVDTGVYSAQQMAGSIEIKNLSFSHFNSSMPVLHNISLNIAAGESVAFVGESGSGKSTLANLLLRFYQAPEKSIFIDNRPIEDWSLFSLRKQFAYVSQNISLFDDSIAANIAYGNVNSYNLDKINQAIEFAHLQKLVDDLPDGLNALIGENGCRLSGGQCQRIAIARAIYRNAPIIVMDEATSALDNQSESEIKSAIKNLMGNKTVIMIAHRLSTIENVDRIFVFDSGRVVEQGSHDELINYQGIYKRLYEQQSSRTVVI
ncbi:lipid A export permease/ATP-binding protein MsbA [Aliikangiella sp. IMCC44359]|uniref:lipid A export permease/ATP-binding protein MsbA n=1 Tax=Aliikangiella sp. IMCC44359 TaxID=3459125 RepID=UPI00403AC8D3